MLAVNDNWRSPEAYFRGELNKPTDLFSLGAMCIYAVLGRVVFGPDEDFRMHESMGTLPAFIRLQRQVSYFVDKVGIDDLLKHISGDQIDSEILLMLWEDRNEENIPYIPFSEWPDVCDVAFKHLIRGLTCLDPTRQITAHQMLQNEWFAGIK
ncbi:calcium/calmodulin dependent protein kinase [Penicillium robsamsonii]|uniref:calcium/calmodulin dependent protein kinase n=1 Tax=Penicillium robsamsonii TaxID=1792511 RepID=UPI002548B001|nr:calcium/calmodulin dependent protein kinase [Penicillium robsamsonii]KAJ5823525.1 calcium/calmodulin dependent protein kinase [Penicillium robsamsonii]